MANLNDLCNIVFDLLDEVDIYEHQVNVLGYDNSYREFSTRRGDRNYDKIIRILKNLDIPDPEKEVKQTMDTETFKDYCSLVLRTILGEKYEEDIKITKALITPDDYYHMIDIKTEYKKIAGINTACGFVLSHKHNPIQLAQLVNSEVTVLTESLYRNFKNTIANIHYNRLPGILSAYLAIYELSKILKQPNLVEDYENFFVYGDSNYALDKGSEIIKALPSYRQKGLREHNEHNKFSFLVSDIYSTNLFERYLEDEKEFLEKYREMLKGNLSIPDYLDYYGMTLQNNSVTQKYIEKVDEVQKRYERKK